MLFSRLRPDVWTDYFLGDPSGRSTAHELKTEGYPKLSLIGAHLHAAKNLNEHDRAEWARKVVADVRLIEGKIGHTRTILVGDLNMNPFDRGLVDTTVLHATMSRSMTHLVQRLKHRRDHLPFYNPMWSLLGDRTGSELAGGSYFHFKSQALSSHFWQMFDQVLLRPDLMDSLTRLEILESDGEDSLLTPLDRPKSVAIVDHLPLWFELTLPLGAS